MIETLAELILSTLEVLDLLTGAFVDLEADGALTLDGIEFVQNIAALAIGIFDGAATVVLNASAE